MDKLLLPPLEKILVQTGQNIKFARLRRKLTTDQVSERADITRKTLYSIEQGSPAVAMGAYSKVLFALGLEKDLLKLAADDILGRKLQDAEIVVRGRAPKKDK